MLFFAPTFIYFLDIFIGSKELKNGNNSQGNNFEISNQSLITSRGHFLRPSKRTNSKTVQRSMSLETQLSEFDSIALKNQKCFSRLSNKRSLRKSCDEMTFSKVPKLMENRTIENQQFDENKTTKRPAHRLPWPKLKRRTSPLNESENIPDLPESDKKTVDKKDSQHYFLEPETLLCSENKDHNSKIEGCVLYKNVEVSKSELLLLCDA